MHYRVIPLVMWAKLPFKRTLTKARVMYYEICLMLHSAVNFWQNILICHKWICKAKFHLHFCCKINVNGRNRYPGNEWSCSHGRAILMPKIAVVFIVLRRLKAISYMFTLQDVSANSRVSVSKTFRKCMIGKLAEQIEINF